MHSDVVGGSNAARRIQCPGSGALEAKVPNHSSAAAEEGTDLHYLMEQIVGLEMHPEDLLGDRTQHIPAVTYEHVGLLQWCLRIVDDTVIGEFDLEVTAPFPGIEGAFGTCDVVAWRDDEMHILDYKFGHGKVIAKNNAQLLFYACCMRAKYGPEEQYALHVLQPRLDHHDTWVVENEDLDRFERRLQEAIARARDVYVTGPECAYCRARAICPAQRNTVTMALAWSPAAGDLADAMAMVADVEAWAKSVREMAHRAMQDGVTIPGFKLVDKRGTRKWVDEARALAFLEEAGLSLDEAAPREVLTPAAAEKAIKPARVEEKLVVSVSSGTTVVSDDDPRPSVHRRLEDLAAVVGGQK